jgi:hypothetical protein
MTNANSKNMVIATALVDTLGATTLSCNGEKFDGHVKMQLKLAEGLSIPIKFIVWDSRLDSTAAAVVLRGPSNLGFALCIADDKRATLLVLDYEKGESVDRVPDAVLKAGGMCTPENIEDYFIPMLVAKYTSHQVDAKWVRAQLDGLAGQL